MDCFFFRDGTNIYSLYSDKSSILFNEKQPETFFNLFTFFREREARNNSSILIALPESFNTLMHNLRLCFYVDFHFPRFIAALDYRFTIAEGQKPISRGHLLLERACARVSLSFSPIFFSFCPAK